jgi:uncharacterized protein
MPNQLSDELSPYLLQHAGNPVDWRPWGDEALGLARSQQKPIFLSIGYAACHWCHVMAHESFEDAEIAGLLNEHFICIKVDREERPDLDMIYMEAVQMVTGRGGWPMSLFLTPECKPFYGGTYWPPRARGGMSGFDQVVRAVADAWQNHRNDLLAQAERITQLLESHVGEEPGRVREMHQSEATLQSGALHAAYNFDAPQQAAEAALRQAFDPQFGGFGPAPKYPQPLALRWLLGRWRRTHDDALLQLVTTTLDRMQGGGLFDHLGGGFHRYSVDQRWLVPHFEKMLYDNGLLAGCYLEAWEATGHERYAAIVRQTLDYLLRDMADPLGGFYSSEDADSEGEEGKFYLWTPAEIETVLGPEAANVFCRVYDVTEAGNFEGRNILNLSRPLELEAKMLGRAPTALAAELAADRQKLLAARNQRVHPGRDDKVLVGWNSFAIDALARAGRLLGEPRYTAAADRAADFLGTHLRHDGRLLHNWRAGRAGHQAYLDDYAGLANALVTLHETTGAAARLDQAAGLADDILTRFADPQQGGFFYTAADDEPLIVRNKDMIDSPIPSGNGLAAMLLLRLAAHGRSEYRAAAEATFQACAAWMQQAPTGTFQLWLAMDWERRLSAKDTKKTGRD